MKIEKKINIQEISDTIYAYCRQHDKPILRQKAIEVFKITKTDIRKLESAGHIKTLPVYIKLSDGRRQTAIGIYSARYIVEQETKSKQAIEAQAQAKKEQTKKELWLKQHFYVRIQHWLLKKAGFTRTAQRMYDNLTNTVLS